jgi:hypothetical protein
LIVVDALVNFIICNDAIAVRCRLLLSGIVYVGTDNTIEIFADVLISLAVIIIFL